MLLFWLIELFYRVTVNCYHDTYAFQSNSTLYSCLNVKELPVRNNAISKF